jgi:hypothetical protein
MGDNLLQSIDDGADGVDSTRVETLGWNVPIGLKVPTRVLNPFDRRLCELGETISANDL